MSLASDSENWEQLQNLFHLAEDVPDESLDALLLGASANPELRRRAKALITAERTETAAAPSGTATGGGLPLDSASGMGNRIGAGFGNRIGPYSILRHLGSGGIGAVYLVERLAGGTLQRVALKVLSLHAVGPFFLDRFAREQHILASLDHPHITRMIDAGVSDTGQPYLAMEYVEGLHLDTYCDDRSLDIPARLKLFLEVCDAVAYAHRNLVVHLDLKPSNILVSAAKGSVKLLDFGTSKLIQPDSLLTTTVMATPAYASPEQLRNEAVTTACDIYTLGAILFELLAGRRPNQDSSVAIMIERSIKELPPESLTEAVTAAAAEHRGLSETRLRSQLQGDLATIVAKCLNPIPADRYPSVDALITDLERYLAGRPILARPQTTGYKIGKFVRRNRKSVVAATLAILALGATTGYGLVRQEEALREGQRALQMQTFMHQLFQLANTDYMGKPSATVPEFLQLGMKVLPEFIKNPKDLRAAQLSLAESMFDNDDFEHAEAALLAVIASAKSAGDLAAEAEAEGYAGATAYFLGNADLGRALSAHAYTLAHKPGVTPSARVLIETYYVYSREAGGFRTDENVRILEDALKECHSRHLSEEETASTIGWLAGALNARGENVRGEQLLKENVAIYSREPYAICDLASTYLRLGNSYYVRGSYQESLDAHRNAYERYQTCAGAEGLNTLEAAANLGRDLVLTGQVKQGVAQLEASLPAWQKHFAASSDFFMPYKMLAQAYLLDRQFAKSEASARKASEILEATNALNMPQRALCQMFWARALMAQGRTAEALLHAETADREYSSLASIQPIEKKLATQARQLLAECSQAASQPATGVPAK